MDKEYAEDFGDEWHRRTRVRHATKEIQQLSDLIDTKYASAIKEVD